MNWVHAVGAYLVAGAVIFGFGWMAKKGWIAAGKMEPIRGKWARMSIGIGTVLGVLLWPFLLAAFFIGWRIRRRTRRLERFLGYCEHATIWEPYCRSCERDIKREDGEQMGMRVSIQGLETRMDHECREKVAAYIEEHPACPGCGKIGTFEQYLESLWVKCSECGRRVFTPDPTFPEHFDTVPASAMTGEIVRCFYDCADCGASYEGRPPAARADGRPVCVVCKAKHLRTQ